MNNSDYGFIDRAGSPKAMMAYHWEILASPAPVSLRARSLGALIAYPMAYPVNRLLTGMLAVFCKIIS